MPGFNFVLEWRNEAHDWCRGKSWIIRLPVALGFVYIFYKHLTDPNYSSILQALNLGIHEVGHFIFAYFGRFLHVLGGTFWECLAPFLGMWNFYRQRDFFAISLCFGWLSTALFDVARYSGDARAMELPLVAPFGGGDDGVSHDWNYLLGQMGLLEADQTVSLVFRSLAILSMSLCFLASIWLLWHMLTWDSE